MRDNNNVIDLELPLSGNMSDPEFKHAHLIAQAFSNGKQPYAARRKNE